MFSKPIISPLGVFNFPYLGATFITGVSVKLTVFADTPPHPLLNALIIVFELVLGGPDPITNGFGNLIPLTSMLISVMIFSFYYFIAQPIYHKSLDDDLYKTAKWNGPHRSYQDQIQILITHPDLERLQQ